MSLLAKPSGVRNVLSSAKRALEFETSRRKARTSALLRARHGGIFWASARAQAGGGAGGGAPKVLGHLPGEDELRLRQGVERYHVRRDEHGALVADGSLEVRDE